MPSWTKNIARFRLFFLSFFYIIVLPITTTEKGKISIKRNCVVYYRVKKKNTKKNFFFFVCCWLIHLEVVLLPNDEYYTLDNSIWYELIFVTIFLYNWLHLFVVAIWKTPLNTRLKNRIKWRGKKNCRAHDKE